MSMILNRIPHAVASTAGAGMFTTLFLSRRAWHTMRRVDGRIGAPLRREMLALAQEAFNDQPRDFDQLMRLRLEWADNQPTRPGLIQLEDKLASRALAQRCDVPFPPLVATFEGDNWLPADLVKVINPPGGLQHRLCCKVTQLYAGLGVLLCEDNGSICFPEPTGPGQQLMTEWQSEATRRSINCTADAAAQCLYGMKSQRAASKEAKPLREVPSRVMVEHAVDVDFELRVLTVLGEVIGAASDSNKHYTLQGKLGEQVKAAAERMSQRCQSDMLRIDFFITQDGKFLLNECCAFLWPEDDFFSQQTYERAYHKMMAGYVEACAPTWSMRQIDSKTWQISENYASFAGAGSTYQTQQVHFYCVVGRQKIALVDTGTGRVPLDEVVRRCEAEIGQGREMVVFLTHWHDDHSGGVVQARGRWPMCQVRLEQNEANLLGLDALALHEGYQEDLGGVTIKAIATPGHTAGSFSFIAGHCLLSGDCFVDGGLTYVSDYEALSASLVRLQDEAAGAKMRVYPSHANTDLSTDRIRAAHDALTLLQEKRLWERHDQPMVPSESDLGCWCEYDDALSCNIVQAGPDFAFAELSPSHEH